MNDRAISVTLRTPGHDEELVTGFLAGEGLLRAANDVAALLFQENPTPCCTAQCAQYGRLER